ncbi:diacylglycerol O-acyltransferase 1, partial [Oleoguttula sp. CCFEE 5521]
MIAPISPPRTPTTPTNPRYRKPVPIYPREQAMALNSEPADPMERESLHLPPKTYVDAAEEGLSGDGDQGMNEAAVKAVKETPPRKQHARISSESRPSSELHEPRALGDIIDEDERSSLSHSPSLRHVSGRLEEIIPQRETYADTVKEAEPVTPRSNGKHENGWARNGIAVLTGGGAEESYSGVGIDESPRSPVKHAHKRVSSRSLHASATKQAQQAHAGEGKTNGTREMEEPSVSSSPTLAQANETSIGASAKPETSEEQPEPALAALEKSQIVIEPLRSKSGHDLASIAVGGGYNDSLTRPENREIAPRSKMPVQHKRQHSELTSGRRAGAGWSQSKIRMAPLNVPLQRRLQTAVVLMHTLSIAGGLTIFLLLCTIPLLWPILLPYLIYVLLSNAGVSGDLSHRSDRWRYSKIWSLFASYFPARLHRTVELEPTR